MTAKIKNETKAKEYRRKLSIRKKIVGYSRKASFGRNEVKQAP